MRGSHTMRAITSRPARRTAPQHRQRTLLGHPCDAGHHQRERDGEPALLQREGQRQRQRRDSAGGKERAAATHAGLHRALVQLFGREAETARRTAAPARRTGSSVRNRDAVIQARSARTAARTPQAAQIVDATWQRRAALREKAGGGEQRRERRAEQQMRADSRLPRLGASLRRRAGGRDRVATSEFRRSSARSQWRRARRRPPRRLPFRCAMQWRLSLRSSANTIKADGSWRLASTSSSAPNR